MTELEKLLKAKIPCPETGIEVKTTLCDICAPGMHCGVDAYVKDGVVIKTEGSREHPANRGLLCAKGAAGRQYIYREDRIKTPLRRVGGRGEGAFEPISWDEAYAEIARGLNSVKEKYGPNSVAFFSGYAKWYRAMLRRFCHAFGSVNYGSESSSCFMSTMESWLLTAGAEMVAPDIGNAKLFLGFSFNPGHSNFRLAQTLIKRRAEGLKVILVDTRRTPTTEKLCDLLLQIRPGTDGALALCFANEIIKRGLTDKSYIDGHVHGYREFAESVRKWDVPAASRVTGAPEADIERALDMIARYAGGPIAVGSSGASTVHHINGMQNHRAISSLTALLGSFDRVGGNIPLELTSIHTPTGFPTFERDFERSTQPEGEYIGAGRFPVWCEVLGEMQANDLPRQILEGTPYPVRAVFAHGMNYRMWNGDYEIREALESLDFFVDIDLFMTDTAKFADIVLPACSSFERSEVKGYGGGFMFYTSPVIPPLYDSKPDADILTELANFMDLPDPLLRSGYDACMKYIFSTQSLDLDELKKSRTPLRSPEARPPRVGDWSYPTPTGKFELKSTVLEKYADIGLDALPSYYDPLDSADSEKYPFTLSAGVRLPMTLHSRLHSVPWLRSLRPEPMADISRDDAERLGIRKNDDIEIFTERGAITVKANPSICVLPGTVHMYHGYSEADVNSLLPCRHNDPYSGFPGYLSSRCGIRAKEAVK